MITEIETDRDQMNETMLDIVTLVALIGPALAWISQAGQIDCGHNCYDLHRIGENYRFFWPLAVSVALGTRTIYAYRMSNGTNLILPILTLIVFAILTVFGWILLILVVGVTYPLANLLVVPLLPFALCYGLDRSLVRFHGKSLNLQAHWWERLSIHVSLLVPLAMVITIAFAYPHLYFFHM